MTRGRDRLEECGTEQARQRLRQAELYLDVAEASLRRKPARARRTLVAAARERVR